jgi:hypothetical protein
LTGDFPWPMLAATGKTMSFRAETYRVMIGSPSDLGEEREAATHANQ